MLKSVLRHTLNSKFYLLIILEIELKLIVQAMSLQRCSVQVKKRKALTKQVKTCSNKCLLKTGKWWKILPNIEGFQGSFLKHKSQINQPCMFHVDLALTITKTFRV